jgi:hypothetical protein
MRSGVLCKQADSICCALPAFAAACGSSSQTATAPTSPTPISDWMVTIKTVGNNGPSFCIVTPTVGAVGQSIYHLAWHGDTVSFMPPDPNIMELLSYTVQVSGLNFAGSNPPIGSSLGMCTHHVQASAISSSFTPDQRSFKASETASFTLDSRQVKTITDAWSGTLRQ